MRKKAIYISLLLIVLSVGCNVSTEPIDTNTQVNNPLDNSDLIDQNRPEVEEFNIYDYTEDFSVNSLDPSWTNYDNKGLWSVDNGLLTGSRESGYTFLIKSDLNTTNTTIEADLNLYAVTSGKTGYIGLLLHSDINNPSKTYCRVLVTSENEVKLQAKLDSNELFEDEISYSYRVGESINIKLEVVDNTYRVYIDGELKRVLVSFTDKLITGHPSLYIQNGEGTFDNVIIHGTDEDTSDSVEDTTETEVEDTTDNSSENQEYIAPVSIDLDIASEEELEVYCNSFDKFEDALSSMKAGQTIILKDGDYLGEDFSVEDVTAYVDYPVIIKAESVGGVRLTDTVKIANSHYITIEGFSWFGDDNSYLKIIENSTHIKVTRCTFNCVDEYGNYITSNQKPLSTSNLCDSIEISYCSFLNKNNEGGFVSTFYDDGSNTDGTKGVATNVWIHHNYFYNVLPVPEEDDPTDFVGDSDRETLVFGTQNTQDFITNNIVEYNLFDNCDGENEIMTIKTSNNTIRYNTFKNCLGSVSIRFGTETEVYNNYFFADDTNLNPFDTDSGGIRCYGSYHKIYNNYMDGLKGTGYRNPIMVDSGDTSDSSGSGGHELSKGVEVVNNTLVNCVKGIGIGNNYTMPTSDIIISNNIICNSLEQSFTIGESEGTIFEGNITYNDSGTVSSETVSVSKVGDSKIREYGEADTSLYALVEDPLLELIGDVYRLTELSPAIDGAEGSYSYIQIDMDGDDRFNNDIGADEYGNSGNLYPLTITDVGPLAL